MEPGARKYSKAPSNTVYNIDGASCGMDETLLETLRLSIRAKVKRGALEIPRLPQVASKVLQLSQDPEVHVEKVTETVQSDPVLAARLLSLANAAANGARVESLNAAILRLGLGKLRDLVFAESMEAKVFPSKGYRTLLEPSWRLSLGAGVACEALAKATGLERDSAFLVGLLHEIGKPTLVQTILEYERKNEGKSMGEELVEVVLSQLHEEIGAYVLEKWEMPAAAIEAARAHHRYQESADGPPAHKLICAANLICDHLGLGEEQRSVSFNLERAFLDLKLSDPEQVEKIVEKVREDVDKLMAGFGGKAAASAG